MTGPEGDVSRGWWEVLAVEPLRRLELIDGFADADGQPNEAMPTTRTVVTLSERDGGTVMDIETRFASLEEMDRMVSMGMEEGITLAVGQMDGILAGATSA
jgi:uncharacterized protein YndB with AHSA1/START domain